MHSVNPSFRLRSAPSRARGAVLFIALIVLVAMTLAGIAIMRSVDTATLRARLSIRASACRSISMVPVAKWFNLRVSATARTDLRACG